MAMELRLGNRTNTLEAAILKGLKVISDKQFPCPAATWCWRMPGGIVKSFNESARLNGAFSPANVAGVGKLQLCPAIIGWLC
eukprot:1161235-Pelagomonas_calceolata.AAC.13